MKFLFIHQNIPGQYVHVAHQLAQAGHEVAFITQPRKCEITGVRKLEYRPALPSSDAHAYVHELESAITNGLAVAGLCEWLASDRFVPDVVIGHNGWGEILYVKDVWPKVPLLGYFEFFYRAKARTLISTLNSRRNRMPHCGCVLATRSTSSASTQPIAAKAPLSGNDRSIRNPISTASQSCTKGSIRHW